MTWKKGQTGNPNGGVKRKHSFTESFRRASALPVDVLKAKNDDIVKNPKCKMIVMEAIGVRFAMQVLKGDSKLAKELFDRMEGKVPQPIQGGGDGAPPVIIQVTSEDGSVVKW